MNIKDLIDKLPSDLSADQQAAVVDAMQAIIASMTKGGMGPLPPISEIEVDPDLLDPDQDKDDDADTPDADIDDPDDLLSKKDSDGSDGEDEEDNTSDYNGKSNAKTKSRKSAEQEREEGSTGSTADEGDKSGEESDEAEENKGSTTGDSDTESDGSESDGTEGTGEASEGEEEYSEPEAPEFIDKDYVGSAQENSYSRSRITSGSFKRKHRLARTINELENRYDELKDDPEADKDLVDKLKQEIDKLNEALENESYKDISNDEFEDMINDALDTADKAKPLTYDTSDKTSRAKKIKDDAERYGAGDEIEDEIRDNITADPAFIKAREEENKKFDAIQTVQGPDAFTDSFYLALAHQVESYIESREDTYMRPHRRNNEEGGVLRKGERVEELPDEEDKPEVSVYIDQSGSWGSSEIKLAMQAIAKVRQDFENKGLLKMNIYYFGDTLKTTTNVGGSSECWDYVVENINNSKAMNVVIVTDSDILVDYRETGHHGAIYGPHTSVPGHVWWLWKNEYAAERSIPSVKNSLYGHMGTHHYHL